MNVRRIAARWTTVSLVLATGALACSVINAPEQLDLGQADGCGTGSLSCRDTQGASRCVNVTSNVSHCGECDNACGSSIAGRIAACELGTCVGCERAPANYFKDDDGDGYGIGPGMTFCNEYDGYASRSGDCDDSDPQAFPGQGCD